MIRLAWGTCPACSSHMETVDDDGRQVESCPNKECPYHVKEKR